MTARTVRNRTMRVRKRLQKSADVLASQLQHERCPEAVIDLDGAYVRARHPRPERNFEVIVSKVLDLIRYLEANADSLPNYGRRYRARQRISTGFAESAVNEIVAKRMKKKQQVVRRDKTGVK